ncbi:flavodoxin family protein [Methanosphaera sp.]
MKIVGINTSPRVGSNSNIALKTALKAAEDKGAETIIYNMNDMNIKTCQADDYCTEHEGKCALDDDMQEIYSAIDEADGIILATPVYMGNISSHAKIFIDRLHSIMHSDTLQRGSKKISLIATQAAIEPPMYAYIKNNLETTCDIFGGIGFEVEDIELLIGNNKEEAILDKQDQLDKATAVGNRIVR